MALNFNISSEEFCSQYQDKKPLLIKHAIEPNSFTWKNIDEILSTTEIMSSNLKLSKGELINKSEYIESYYDVGLIKYRIIKPKFYDILKNGATLILNRIKNNAYTDLLSRQITNYCGREAIVNAYGVFKSVESSFRNHWDTRDVFALQLIGKKRWVIYEPSFLFPLHTQQSKDNR